MQILSLIQSSYFPPKKIYQTELFYLTTNFTNQTHCFSFARKLAHKIQLPLERWCSKSSIVGFHWDFTRPRWGFPHPSAVLVAVQGDPSQGSQSLFRVSSCFLFLTAFPSHAIFFSSRMVWVCLCAQWLPAIYKENSRFLADDRCQRSSIWN